MKACAWIVFVVSLAVTVVVLLLRGLGDAGNVATLVAIPLTFAIMVIDPASWFRRSGQQDSNQVFTTIKDAEPSSRGTRSEQKPWFTEIPVDFRAAAGPHYVGVEPPAVQAVGAPSVETTVGRQRGLCKTPVITSQG